MSSWLTNLFRRDHFLFSGAFVLFLLSHALALQNNGNGFVIEETGSNRFLRYDSNSTISHNNLILSPSSSSSSSGDYELVAVDDMVYREPKDRKLTSRDIQGDEAGEIFSSVVLPTNGLDEFWKKFEDIDSKKDLTIYSTGETPDLVLRRFRYIILPIWWSDEDENDVSKTIKISQINDVMQYTKDYYEGMSWGLCKVEVATILAQEKLSLSSAKPDFSDTERIAKEVVASKGYVHKVDFDGIIFLYNTARDGPFKGHGGWGNVNSEYPFLWMSYPWGLGNSVSRHEVGHNFGHPHHYSYKYYWRFSRKQTGDWYDGYDMMSGGNGYETSDLALASKWFFGWVPDTSIITMQAKGADNNCPTCVSEGLFRLLPFDDWVNPPQQNNIMGIHIPITAQSSKLYSYWLSYRTGNSAKKGLSLHLSWFDIGHNGMFGATYDSYNYDVNGNTDTTSDSFIEPGKCYVVTQSSVVLDLDPYASTYFEPVVCVNELSEGNFIDISVSFIKPDLEQDEKLEIGKKIDIDCNHSTTQSNSVDLSKYNLINFYNGGKKAQISFEACTSSGETNAYFYDSFPKSPIYYNAPTSYGSFQSVSIDSEECSSEVKYMMEYGHAWVLTDPSIQSGSLEIDISCDIIECQKGYHSKDGICVPCDASSIDCKSCPDGTFHMNNVCIVSEEVLHVAASKGWRIWAPSDHIVKKWAWDISELEFWSNSDCTGTRFLGGDVIDSGHYPSTSWEPIRAFDSWGSWGGRYNDDKLFWLGMIFDSNCNVKCVRFGQDNDGAEEVRVQALKNNVWVNVKIEKTNPIGWSTLVLPEVAFPTTPPSPKPTTPPSPKPTTPPSPKPTEAFHFQIKIAVNKNLCIQASKQKLILSPCDENNLLQSWFVDDTGRIHNYKKNHLCIKRKKTNALLTKCGTSTAFNLDYSLFFKKIFLMSNSSIVLGVNDSNATSGSKIKFVKRDTSDDLQSWDIIY